MTVDYTHLGGLLGAVWRAHHPEQGYNHTDRLRAIRVVQNVLGLDDTVEGADLLLPMLYAMQSRCYLCGADVAEDSVPYCGCQVEGGTAI